MLTLRSQLLASVFVSPRKCEFGYEFKNHILISNSIFHVLLLSGWGRSCTSELSLPKYEAQKWDKKCMVEERWYNTNSYTIIYLKFELKCWNIFVCVKDCVCCKCKWVLTSLCVIFTWLYFWNILFYIFYYTVC